MSLHEKKNNNNLCFGPGPTQTRLYNHRNRLDIEMSDLERRDMLSKGAKTKAPISCAVIAQLNHIFVFTFEDCLFNYVVNSMRRLIFYWTVVLRSII